MIDSLLYAKLPQKLKRSVNMARLENATYEEIVTHLVYPNSLPIRIERT